MYIDIDQGHYSTFDSLGFLISSYFMTNTAMAGSASPTTVIKFQAGNSCIAQNASSYAILQRFLS